MTKYSRIGRRHPDTAPISKDQITTLKQKVQRVENIDNARRTTVWDHICDMWTQFTYSFKPKSNQCRIYGHTLPSGGWQAGRRPNCGDCGTQINDADDLRKAQPRY
jgi:hypothetical protein